MSNSSKKGFTLVELSIVLVIIGLLIGGILVAQSMIGTAKLQSAVRQLGQFDAAVANFYTKFNQIPGDDSVMGSTTGNNDGFIASDATTAVAKFDREIGKFWYDLSTSGLKPTGSTTSYTDGSAAAAASVSQTGLINTYIPQSPIGSNLGVVAYGGIAGSNYYMISAFNTGAAAAITTVLANSLKGADALAIDAKIDDGVPNAGGVLGVQSTGLNTTGVGTTYSVTATPAYSLAIRLGTQTGNLQ